MTKTTKRTIAALFALAVIITVLHLAARLDLRGPTGLSGSELGDWLEDPVIAAATVARWVALGLSYYLFVAVAAIGLFVSDIEEQPTGIRRLFPASLTSAIGVALGIGIPLASATTFALSTDPPAPAPVEALQLMAVEDPLVLQPDVDTKTTKVQNGLRPHDSLHPVRSATPTVDSWLVESGDSLWSIAEETLQDHSEPGDVMTDETIAAYWRVVIEANLDRLVEPGNPDLIMPGQEIVLPPITRG